MANEFSNFEQNVFKKLNNLERYSSELRWARVFGDCIKSSRWLKDQCFEVGNFAAGYPFLYLIYRVLNDFAPKNILELGLGQSTRLTAQYCASRDDVKLAVADSDKEWLDFFVSTKLKPILGDALSKINFIHDPCIMRKVSPTRGDQSSEAQYRAFADLPAKLAGCDPFDLILIDAPVGTPGLFSRRDILDITALIGDEFVIMLDDAERMGESQTFHALLSFLNKERPGCKLHSNLYRGLKDTVILTSEKFRFASTV